jgi:F-type H+-transporting ATPase subunit a
LDNSPYQGADDLMEGINFLETPYWRPLASMGLTHHFFNVNAETVIMTWVLLGVLLLIAMLIHTVLPYPESRIRHLALSTTRSFMEFVTQTLKTFSLQHFCFATSLFVFIFISSLLALIPLLEEPTKDLNTTFALGLSSFFYIQYQGIKKRGLLFYIKGFFSPIFLMFPINLISTCSTAVSISLRLFGNIFGGAIISSVVFGTLGGLHYLFARSWFLKIVSILFAFLGIGLSLATTIFFNIFDGGLQAFVFFMLTLTYLSITLEGGGH